MALQATTPQSKPSTKPFVLVIVWEGRSSPNRPIVFFPYVFFFVIFSFFLSFSLFFIPFMPLLLLVVIVSSSLSSCYTHIFDLVTKRISL